MQKRTRTMFALLGFLSDGPKSGYDIKKAIEGSTSNFWQESYGQIYPMLHRLAEQGFTRHCPSERSNRRERQAYEITDRGRQSLRQWIEAPTEPEPVRHELLLKIFFGAYGAGEDIRHQLEHFRQRQQDHLNRYSSIRESLTELLPNVADARYWLATVDYGESQARAQIDWCERTLQDLCGDDTATADRHQSGGGVPVEETPRG